MRPGILFGLLVGVLTQGCAHSQPVDLEALDARARSLLDDWHGAAAEADFDGYLGALDEGGVFLGTDGTERWDRDEFAAFVEPYFAEGVGWTYRPVDRKIEISNDGALAWFDERLLNDGYGELRGTGVLRMTREGWRISQYNMTFVLPNGVTRRVVKLIRESDLEGGVPPCLPAGTYFTTATYRAACEGCAVPRYAVVAGVFDSEADCEEPLKRLSTVPLQTGYPLVIHTDELAPADDDLDGIALVLGLFEERERASRWLAEMGELVGTVRVVEILEREAAYDRAYEAVESGEADEMILTRLVRIQAGPPVEAYAPSDVDEFEEKHGIVPLQEGELEPLCVLEPGSFFAVRDRTFNHRYYSTAPVKCPDGSTALVPWKKTLLDTAIVPDEDGRGVLRQVVGAECDSPMVEQWYYDEKGRYRFEGEGEKNAER